MTYDDALRIDLSLYQSLMTQKDRRDCLLMGS